MPKWDPSARTLTIFLARGQIAHPSYASFVDPAAVEQLGIPSYAATAAQRQAIERAAMAGINWLITPSRPLTLVHATQHPVCQPAFLALAVQRALGDTFVDLSARVQLHGPSTGKLEVLARWTEWIDDPAQGDPVAVAGGAQLAEQALPENFQNRFSLEDFVGAAAQVRPNRHELGDTKFRLVRYHLLATTRFREYLPPALAEDPGHITRLGPPLVPPPDPIDGDPGHPVVFTPSPAELHRVVVPCSARPHSPRVVSVVPTFKWDREVAQRASQRSTRYGCGLRVYLERPWFSSGDGELLGVVLLDDATTREELAAHRDLTALISQWGADPIFDGEAPPETMRAASFPARVAVEAAALDELPGTSAYIVGHRVQWDGQRKLWYCDIELSLGASYFPFVRLALVRYQPHALAEAKISRVVLADFAQVVPRRAVSMDRTGNVVQLVVRGPAPAHGSIDYRTDSPYVEFSPAPGPGGGETGRNRIEVALQARDAALGDTDLGWQDDATVPPVSGPAIPSAALSLARAGGRGLAVDIDLFDTPIWSNSFTLPATPGTKELRLVVREYERYYADRTETVVLSGQVRHKRIVEERLVYAETFLL